MSVNDVLSAIQMIGFPAVAFFMVYKTSTEQNEKWSDKIADITKSVVELSEAVKNQTQILTELINNIKGGE